METDLNGAELIARARIRQVYHKGFNEFHDRKYKKGQLLKAAQFCITLNKSDYPKDWDDWFRDKLLKKEERISQLADAGALIAAEIDRINSK